MSTIASFEETAQRLTAEGEGRSLPGLAVVVADNTGAIRYTKNFGTTPTGNLTLDTPIFAASVTKFMTTIAAVQCVERGLLSLDKGIGDVLPELANPEILVGFNEKTDEPILKKAKNKITLRQLLTHSSGLAYDVWEPRLVKYREIRKEQPTAISGDMSKLTYPLVFEPGEGFMYGIGIDWAGKAVERVNGNIRLGEYMKKNIWEPLDIKHTTFRMSDNDYVRENLGKLTTVLPEGGLGPADHFYPTEPVDDCGGAGLFTTASDYLKMLISILKDDGKLLSPATAATLFEPQLSERNVKSMAEFKSDPVSARGFTNGLTGEGNWTFGLGGVLNLEEIPGYRSRKTLSWSGLPNPIWWVDRERKLCGFCAIQLIPFFNFTALDLFRDFQQMVLKEFGK